MAIAQALAVGAVGLAIAGARGRAGAVVRAIGPRVPAHSAGGGYQAWDAPQCGHVTDAETSASQT